MDRLFFNVGLSASLLLSTHPRFASHQETVCWVCLSGPWAKAGFRLFSGSLQLLPAWPGERGHGQTLTAQAAALAQGPSAPSLELCWQGLHQCFLKSPGLATIINEGGSIQPKFVWRTHTIPFTYRPMWTDDFSREAKMKMPSQDSQRGLVIWYSRTNRYPEVWGSVLSVNTRSQTNHVRAWQEVLAESLQHTKHLFQSSSQKERAVQGGVSQINLQTLHWQFRGCLAVGWVSPETCSWTQHWHNGKSDGIFSPPRHELPK